MPNVILPSILTRPVGSSPVTLTVINPDSSRDYNFRFGGVLPRVDGEQVTVVFPGSATQQTYSISLFDGNQLCQQVPPSRKTITVQSAPDATGLTDISGNTAKPFTLCTSTTANPNFNLTVKNESATIDQNTSYTIDWGMDPLPKTLAATLIPPPTPILPRAISPSHLRSLHPGCNAIPQHIPILYSTATFLLGASPLLAPRLVVVRPDPIYSTWKTPSITLQEPNTKYTSTRPSYLPTNTLHRRRLWLPLKITPAV